MDERNRILEFAVQYGEHEEVLESLVKYLDRDTLRDFVAFYNRVHGLGIDSGDEESLIRM